MPFITQGKTNWKFLLIVAVLATVVGGGIFYFQGNLFLPETNNFIQKQKITNRSFQEEVAEEKNEQFIKSWHEVNIDTLNCESISYNRGQDSTIDLDKDVFISPKGGEIYTTDDELIIKWDPAKIDVSTIQLYAADNDYNNCLGIFNLGGIYGRTDLNDPVSKEGIFVYKISSYYLYPADYHVVLSNWGYSRNIMSNPIEIQAAKEVRAPVLGALTMDFVQTISNSSFTEDEYFSIRISAKDSTGRALTLDDGFWVRGKIYKRSSNNYVKSFDGVYSPEDVIWIIGGQLNIPKGDYEIRVQIWCSNTKKPCRERYIDGRNNYVEKKLYFTVK